MGELKLLVKKLDVDRATDKYELKNLILDLQPRPRGNAVSPPVSVKGLMVYI